MKGASGAPMRRPVRALPYLSPLHEPRTAQIPIVALTSLAMKGDREWFLATGFDGHLEKPISVRRAARAGTRLLSSWVAT